MRSEADVVVMSEDGTADDGVLRALRVDQAAEDDQWKKKKAVLRRYSFLVPLTTSKMEVESRVNVSILR